MTEKRKNDYLLQGGILAIAGLITRFIGLVYRIPLTRIVGTEGMAYYNTAYEIYNIALLVSTYSVPVAVSKLIADRDSRGQYLNSHRIFRVGMALSSGIGLSVSLLLFIFAKDLAYFMKWPSAAIPLRVLAPTIFVFSIMGIIRGLFQGKRTMVPTAFSQIIEQIFNAIFSIVAALLLIRAHKDSAEAAAYGAAGGTTGTLVGAVFGLIFLVFIYSINSEYFTRKCLKDHTGIRESDKDIAKMILLTMLPIILSQTIYQLSGILDNYMFSRILFGKGMEEAEKAILYEAYSNKYKWLYNLPVAIASAFGVSIVPTLSATYKSNDLDSVRTKVASSIKVNMIVAIPSAVGLTFLGGPILLLLFNRPDDLLSGKLMTLGGIAVVFFALSTLTNGILQGIDRLSLPVIHSAISLAVHIVLVIVLVGPLNFGAYGLVIGNVTYGLLVCILNWISIGDILEYRQEIRTTFLTPLAASLIMGLISFGIFKGLNLLTHSNNVSVIIAIIVAIPVYFAALLLLKGVSEEELKGFPKGALLVSAAKKMRLLR
ncbi:MAG: polysaccharide biosynthesis protein [Lachnospiraceae bacterium]|nr:polysaccharide biosynthesis protein [Lachnospiraceae bacterium]